MTAGAHHDLEALFENVKIFVEISGAFWRFHRLHQWNARPPTSADVPAAMHSPTSGRFIWLLSDIEAKRSMSESQDLQNALCI